MAEQHSDLGKPKICQAQGCEVDVNPYGRYCRKRRLCPEHLKAASLRRKKYGDERWRFCQQCGKLELLHNFDGLKRSCRVQLARRRAANNKGSERRRSSATEADRTSSDCGSERNSDEGQQQPYDAAATTASPAAAAAAGAVAVAAAAAAAGYGAQEGSGFGPPSKQAVHSDDSGIPPGYDLAAYMQYSLENAALLSQQQQQMLQAQAGQQGLFGMQQQQQQQQAGGMAMPGSVAGGPLLPTPSTHSLSPASGMPASAAQPNSGSELLLQLLKEQQQQLRDYQQQQQQQPQQQQQQMVPENARPPSRGSQFTDVYSMGLNEAAAPIARGGSGGTSGQFANPPSRSPSPAVSMQLQQQLAQQQQQQMAQQQRQNSGSQQSLLPGVLMQGVQGIQAVQGNYTDVQANYPEAQGNYPEAQQSGRLALLQNLTSAGFNGAQQLLQQQQQQQELAARQRTTPDLFLGPNQVVSQQAWPTQQQEQQQRVLAAHQRATPELFLGPDQVPSQQTWPSRSQFSTPLSDFGEGLEDVLLAAAASALAGTPTPPPAAAAAAVGLGRGPTDLRSLSAAEAQTISASVLRDIRGHPQPQQQLRTIDSAPARLAAPGGRAAASAAGDMRCGLLSLAQAQAIAGNRSAAAAAAAVAAGAAGTAASIPLSCAEVPSRFMGLLGNPLGGMEHFQGGIRAPSPSLIPDITFTGAEGAHVGAGMEVVAGQSVQGVGPGMAVPISSAAVIRSQSPGTAAAAWLQAGGTATQGGDFHAYNTAQGALLPSSGQEQIQQAQQGQGQGRAQGQLMGVAGVGVGEQGAQQAPGQTSTDFMMQQLQQSRAHLAAELQALLDSTR